MELLRSGLSSECDHETVMKTIERLPVCAASMGPAGTRSELLQFLTEYCDVDNDEAHTAIARHLGSFASLVGGPQYTPLLLPLLERLCGEEEFVVRDAAVGALNQLVASIVDDDIANKYIPMLKRLLFWFSQCVSTFLICTLLHRIV